MLNRLSVSENRIFCVIRTGGLCLLLLLQSSFAVTSGAQAESENTIPAWYKKKLSIETEGTGTWIADNSKYKSDQEPYDAYGLEHRWGIGKKSITFRLYAITKNQDVGTMWEFREFWHPGEKKVLVYQWGRDGTLGYGELKPVDIANGKFELEQTFYSPDGSSMKSRHESIETETERTTKSFVFQDGAWKENRTYLWRLSK